MKKISLVIIGLLLATFTYAQDQNTAKQDSRLQVAREGCQKPLGFFPTPSKILCILAASGLNEKQVKPKAVALVFNVCHGYALQPLPKGQTLKKYPTLSACISDPAAINTINRELAAQGFQPLKIVNPSVLAAPTKATSM